MHGWDGWMDARAWWYSKEASTYWKLSLSKMPWVCIDYLNPLAITVATTVFHLKFFNHLTKSLLQPDYVPQLPKPYHCWNANQNPGRKFALVMQYRVPGFCCCFYAELLWVCTRLFLSRWTAISLVGVMWCQRPWYELLHSGPLRNNRAYLSLTVSVSLHMLSAPLTIFPPLFFPPHHLSLLSLHLLFAVSAPYPPRSLLLFPHFFVYVFQTNWSE